MKRQRKNNILSELFISKSTPTLAANKSNKPYILDQCFNVDFTDRISFGDLPIDTLYGLFKDGRAVAPILERYLTHLVPGLIFVDETGYDFLYGEERLECKTFTRRGLNFAPSNMIGKGRTVDLVELRRMALGLVYILCDVTSFPKVRIVFKEGRRLIRDYPTGKIKFDDRWKIFGI